MKDTTSQIELTKQIIQRYFEAYNKKNESIFDEIISLDYIEHGQTASGAKNDLKISLDQLDDLNYVVEDERAPTNCCCLMLRSKM